MGRAIKLVVIGAGSAQFSLGLVRDLCLCEPLRGSTVSLVDVDEGRLGMVYDLARRYAQEMGAGLCFEKTGDRQAALPEADFVINTALAGGHGLEEAERRLLEQHGYYRGFGLAATQRQLALMMDVARDVERLCPRAWLIQSGNPVFEGCTLMTRLSAVRVIGLCHGHYGYREIAEVLGLEPAQVTAEAIGFNHNIWLTHFRYRGQDAYPLIDRWIEEEAEAYWRTWQPRYNQTQMSPAAVHLYRTYGLMPVGDTTRAHCPATWWYHRDLEAKKRWWGPNGGFDSAEGWALYLQDLERNLAEIRQVASDPGQPVTALLPPKASDEQMVPIIDSLANDRPGHYQVNVPNRGALAGIPADVAVEVPALIDGRGVRPLAVGPLPEPIMLGILWPSWLAMERQLAAYRTGDRRYLLQLLLDDHRTRGFDEAERALDELGRLPGNEGVAALR